VKEAGHKLPELPEPLAGPFFIGSSPHIDPALDEGKDAEDQGTESDSDSASGVRRRRRFGAAGGASSLAATLTGDT
jgi:hypothetical protein